MVSHGEKIVAAISTDPKGLALSLHAKGLISDTDFEETNELNETKTAKARRLYSAVKKMIQHHPGRYNDFIRTFKDSGKLHCDLLKALNNSEGNNYDIMHCLFNKLDLRFANCMQNMRN